jgi:hypothetical protein
VEQKHVSQFPTLASYRSMTFSLDRALEDYYRRPVTYTLGLAEVSVELCEVVRQKDTPGYNFAA